MLRAKFTNSPSTPTPTDSHTHQDGMFFEACCHPESASLGSHSDARSNSPVPGRKCKSLTGNTALADLQMVPKTSYGILSYYAISSFGKTGQSNSLAGDDVFLADGKS